MSRRDSVMSQDFDQIKEDLADLDPTELDTILTSEEKRFLLHVERGDISSVLQTIEKGNKENKLKAGSFNINCLDPIGRSALAVAIENENLEMMELLLDKGVEPADTLLHAINEEYVEGVDFLLQHEEKIHKEGELYSWEKMDGIRQNYTSDITPLILAAHKDNYEILRQLLDRGASLPTPHDVKCGCNECLTSTADDSLRHSLARINAYKALASPSLIALSSTDPFSTTFTLTEELKYLATIENEFKEDYMNLRSNVTDFARNLVENTRSSYELEVILNYDPEGEPYEKGQRMHFANLREAVEAKQKKFVAHANVQQLLGTVWYDGMPGFKRFGPMKQLSKVAYIGAMFPFYCLSFILLPSSKTGKAMTKPFIKFIVHSSSYMMFLTLLVVVSLRVEVIIIELFGTDWMIERLREQQTKERGSLPSAVELLIIIYVTGYIWHEMKSLWSEGLLEYSKDLWNIIDFFTNIFYMNWIILRMTSWYLTQQELKLGMNPYLPRESLHPFDPMLVAEGMFSAANIFSVLKLVHIFSVHPDLGPLQVALGRMVFDILKFFFVYTLVLFAFACGLNQMLWYYADLDKKRCFSLPGGKMNRDEEIPCEIWRRFSNLFETAQSLFWASFGYVDIINFDLTGIKSFTRFWGLLMFGCYSVINVIVLLNLLIAMMSNSYSAIFAKCDLQWKYARSKLWMSYFEPGNEVPPPFNLIPNVYQIFKSCEKSKPKYTRKQAKKIRDAQYRAVTRDLVRRFVTVEQRKYEISDVTEDDLNELKQSISTFKHDVLHILKSNGWKTGEFDKSDIVIGRKQQARERRLMKGFSIGMVEGLKMEKMFENQKRVFDITDLVFKTLLASKNKDWNSKIIPKSYIDQIGSSSIRKKRINLRISRRKNTWRRIQFYVRRGVFIGGEINATTLHACQKKMNAAIRRPPLGWIKVQQHLEEKTLHDTLAKSSRTHRGWAKIQQHLGSQRLTTIAEHEISSSDNLLEEDDFKPDSPELKVSPQATIATVSQTRESKSGPSPPSETEIETNKQEIKPKDEAKQDIQTEPHAKPRKMSKDSTSKIKKHEHSPEKQPKEQEKSSTKSHVPKDDKFLEDQQKSQEEQSESSEKQHTTKEIKTEPKTVIKFENEKSTADKRSQLSKVHTMSVGDKCFF